VKNPIHRIWQIFHGVKDFLPFLKRKLIQTIIGHDGGVGWEHLVVKRGREMYNDNGISEFSTRY
jgi:hypothetical protein